MAVSELRSVGAFLRHWAPLLVDQLPQSSHNLRQLLAHRLATRESVLLAHPDRSLPIELDDQLEADVAHILAGRPLAWLYGKQPFLEWSFRCDHRALIPRPETEALVGQIITRLQEQPPKRILDLCCGSGVMGLALALHFRDALVDLSDLSPEALALCRENIAEHQLEGRATCYEGDLWAALPQQRYDLVVANPPYVADDDEVDPQVLQYEPHLALFSEDGGMDHIKRILVGLGSHLNEGGWAAFELGHEHIRTLTPYLASRFDYQRFFFSEDPFGVSRYLFYSGSAGMIRSKEDTHG